jgi:hypothetical protein
MAGFNRNDPRFQRDLQRRAAKASMSGNRANISDIVQAHSQFQLGRQEQFKRMDIEQKQRDRSFNLAKERIRQGDLGLDLSRERVALSRGDLGLRQKSLGLAQSRHEQSLEDSDEELKWSIGLGLGGLGFSVAEGRRRKNERLEDLALRKRQTAALESKFPTLPPLKPTKKETKDFWSLGLK